MRTFLYGMLRPPYSVHVGYSIHTFIKRPKSTFNFLNKIIELFQLALGFLTNTSLIPHLYAPFNSISAIS